jgi:hypothetical protein
MDVGHGMQAQARPDGNGGTFQEIAPRGFGFSSQGRSPFVMPGAGKDF